MLHEERLRSYNNSYSVSSPLSPTPLEDADYRFSDLGQGPHRCCSYHWEFTTRNSIHSSELQSHFHKSDTVIHTVFCTFKTLRLPTRPAASTFLSFIHFDRVTGALHASTSIILFIILRSCSDRDMLKIFKVMSLCEWDEENPILDQRMAVLSRVRDLGYGYDILRDTHTFNEESAYIAHSAFAACTQTKSSSWSHHRTECFCNVHSTDPWTTMNLPSHE